VAIYVDIKVNHAALAKMPQWDEWVGQLRAMQQTLGQTRSSERDRIIGCINLQHRINDIVRVMFAAAPNRAG